MMVFLAIGALCDMLLLNVGVILDLKCSSIFFVANLALAII